MRSYSEWKRAASDLLAVYRFPNVYRPSEQNFIYNVEDVAGKVSEKQPFFAMRSGGIYAVALTGGKPSHFVRVDKDRRPRRERKRMRRMALTLAKATV